MPPRCAAPRFIFPLATVVLLATASCRDTPSEPGSPTEPAIRIESPVAGSTLGDTIVVLRGVAEAPGAVDGVTVSYPTNPGPEGVTIFRTQEGTTPDASIRSPTRVPFEISLNLRAGDRPLTVSMSYRMSADTYVGASTSMAVVVPLRIWRKPTLRLERGPGDTVYGRSLSLRASVTGIDSMRKFDLVVDEGTPNERRAPNRGDWGDPIGRAQPGVDSASWARVELPDTLGDGPHTYVLRLRDEMGLMDSVRGKFVTYVAPARYTLTPLPTLGGTDAAASDVNAAGEVVGWALDAAGRQWAAVWRDGQVSALPDLAAGNTKSLASALNDAGDIVGTVVDGGGAGHAVRWRAGSVSAVGPGPAASFTSAIDVNAAGEILGIYSSYKSFIDRNGSVTDVPMAQPVAFNNTGQVVGGWASLPNGGTSPALYGVAMPNDVAFRVAPVGKSRTSAWSINNNGIALVTLIGDFTGTTYFLTNGTLPSTDLTTALGGPLAGAEITFSGGVPGLDVARITDDGTVLAFDRRSHTAYRWRAGRTSRVTVTTPGWTLDRVSSMNDAGDIVGHATETGTGRTTAVWLRPAP